MKKRGVSPVIATVFIILVTVVLAGILAAFAVPFVRTTLQGSESCFEIIGGLEIYDTGFNCFAANGSTSQASTGFSIRINNEKINGFKVSLLSEGSSDSFNILNGSVFPDIRMLGKDFNEALEVPARGGVRTYVVRGEFDRVDVFALVEDSRVCDLSDSLNVRQCIDPEGEVIPDLTKY